MIDMCNTHTLFEIYEAQKNLKKIEENEFKTCKKCDWFTEDEFNVFGKCSKYNITVAKEHICTL
jgi:hypothetical protein